MVLHLLELEAKYLEYSSTQNIEQITIEKNDFTEILPDEESDIVNCKTLAKLSETVYISYVLIDKNQPDSIVSEITFFYKLEEDKEFIEKCNLPYQEGDMGPLYGFQWKHFGAEYIDCNSDYVNKGFNQIEEVINTLINDPHSRRILLTDYNPSQAKKGVLYPCHSIIIQFYVNEIDNKKMVSMNMYQRSVDSFLGLPFNITSNALLLHLLCKTINKRINKDEYQPFKLNIIMGDIHIYEQHLDCVKEQIRRIPYDFPSINIKKIYDNIENYLWEDIEIINYQSHPSIKAEMIA
jgi:thymidylate synthase